MGTPRLKLFARIGRIYLQKQALNRRATMPARNPVRGCRAKDCAMSATIQQSKVATEDADLVGVEHRGPIAYLTLNRASKYNVLSAAMIARLKSILEALSVDRGTRVVVLAAQGRAFCAGHD